LKAPRFSPRALAFLRALKRNNRREWFQPRKTEYDTLLRAPMIAIVERLAADFRGFAPELQTSPKTSLFRIYRDTRFSADKSPYKTQIAAVFPHRDLAKLGGAGLYFEVGPEGVWAGGGLYAPDTSQLQRVREHLVANLRRFRAIVESPAFRRAVGRLEGEKLQRVPRGFPPDHEAADYLRLRQFLGGREFPASFAASPRFYAGLLSVFKGTAPLVRFLNEPLVAATVRGPRS
jgi:uncharacterized protein (TIGR02453 family)